MNNEPIVREVRKSREAILKSYAWDIEAMLRDMMKRQWESGHTVVTTAPRKASQGAAVDTSTAVKRRKE